MIKLLRRLNQPGVTNALNLIGVTGIFWFSWLFTYYQTIYLQQNGFTASQFGILNSIASVITIVSVTFWGMVSDRIGSTRKVLIILLVGGSGLFALIPFVPLGYSFSPVLLMIFIPFINFFRGSQATLNENLLVRNCNELRVNYGVVRSCGSLIFTLAGIIAFLIIPRLGTKWAFWISALTMIPAILCVYFAHEPHGARRASSGKTEKKERPMLSELFKIRPYVAFLVFAFFFFIAASGENGFFSYFMEGIGVSLDYFILLHAYHAAFEMPFLILMLKLRKKIALKYMIIGACLLMSIECIGMGLFANSFGTMIFFATFYGLGNGLFIGSSVNYIYELAPDRLKASAHALFTSVSGVSAIVGNFISGIVIDTVGAKTFYVFVGCTFLLSAAIFLFSFVGGKKEKAVA